ncbi:hypothetical protein PVK06_008901 [Gossypium arboreum]|uniref:Uncharacterized protein n=1 Tax=Gossypium arboreum TaxID=29729 RepID=A0ABR0QM24_GOSAR|nr:hypothetical protein PVK06_008901 [Gossypium arboreum]
MEKGGSSREVGTEAPKFKRRKVSAVWDFPSRCGRGTTSDFELHRQIAADQSSQGKYRFFFNRLSEVPWAIPWTWAVNWPTRQYGLNGPDGLLGP